MLVYIMFPFMSICRMISCSLYVMVMVLAYQRLQKLEKKTFFSLFAKRYFFSGRICVGFGPKTKTGVFEQSFQGRVSFFWCPLSPPPGPSHVTYLEWGDGG